jgi:hypothetical protein
MKRRRGATIEGPHWEREREGREGREHGEGNKVPDGKHMERAMRPLGQNTGEEMRCSEARKHGAEDGGGRERDGQSADPGGRAMSVRWRCRSRQGPGAKEAR